MSKYDTTRVLNCAIQAVLEPNKVRVISKGESLPYYSCKPLQKALHGAMREMAPFRLIGRPFCPTDMCDLQRKAEKTDKWFSIDYSAATDGLSWKYSGMIFRYLISDLPKHQQEVALQVLGPHNLYYPKKDGRKGYELKGVMQNGQLMGSILSFPILCLANLGTYLLTTRESQREWTYEERLNHVLVNGDDMVYAADESLWEKHVSIARKVGLEMSVGKAYVHETYANINSTSVHLNLTKEGSARDPYQINYLNAGLFFGQHKVQGSTEKMELARDHHSPDPSSGLVVNINTLLSGSLQKEGKEVELLKEFLSVHGPEIAKECLMWVKHRSYTRNLFIPISLGGMGVVPPMGWKYKISKLDLRLALTSIQSNCCPIDSQLPLRGFEVIEPETLQNMPFTVKDVVVEPISYQPGRTELRSLKDLCRVGLHRWGPYKGVLLL
jgi:hypothetical protein